MLIHSFFEENRRLVPMEVELTLWPGLPCIQFVGLPDQQIKESALRIKSAIKSQGFEFPKAQQILVNLRPNTLKKSSQGLELAVAFAYLLESEQIPPLPPEVLQQIFVYGSLTLSGEVRSPQEFPLLKKMAQGSRLITGDEPPSLATETSIASLPDLQALKSDLQFETPTRERIFHRPIIDDDLLWSEGEAEFLSLAAAGGHHALLAGPSGSGKSTMARMIHRLLPFPSLEQEREDIDSDLSWRPLAQPHHSVTVRGLIGGGADVNVGEATRASGGVLLLDEFLEFRPEAMEALREPLETGEIHLARGARSLMLPARFQLVATTNLCPCGRWIPGVKKTYCRFTLSRCRSYSGRLSGPLLDRFQILKFVFGEWGTDGHRQLRFIEPQSVLASIERANDLRLARGQRGFNAHLSLEDLRQTDDGIITANLLPERQGSERRRLATLRAARSFADLSGEKRIRPVDLQKSLKYTYENFQIMSRWD